MTVQLQILVSNSESLSIKDETSKKFNEIPEKRCIRVSFSCLRRNEMRYTTHSAGNAEISSIQPSLSFIKFFYKKVI